MKSGIIILSMLLSLTGCATGNGSESSGEKMTASGEKLICRRERTTSTYRTKKICRTEAQLKAESEAAQRELERIGGRGVSSAPRGGG